MLHQNQQEVDRYKEFLANLRQVYDGILSGRRSMRPESRWIESKDSLLSRKKQRAALSCGSGITGTCVHPRRSIWATNRWDCLCTWSLVRHDLALRLEYVRV